MGKALPICLIIHAPAHTHTLTKTQHMRVRSSRRLHSHMRHTPLQIAARYCGVLLLSLALVFACANLLTMRPIKSGTFQSMFPVRFVINNLFPYQARTDPSYL